MNDDIKLEKIDQQLKYPLDHVTQRILEEFAQKAWPIGSIYISVTSVNPISTLGFGSWTAFGSGRTLVGVDAGQPEFDTVEETGGENTHTLLLTEIPAHSHTVNVGNVGSGALSLTVSGQNTNFQAGAIGSSGGDGAHNNLQPYITVYFWKRTA